MKIHQTKPDFRLRFTGISRCYQIYTPNDNNMAWNLFKLIRPLPSWIVVKEAMISLSLLFWIIAVSRCQSLLKSNHYSYNITWHGIIHHCMLASDHLRVILWISHITVLRKSPLLIDFTINYIFYAIIAIVQTLLYWVFDANAYSLTLGTYFTLGTFNTYSLTLGTYFTLGTFMLKLRQSI